MLPTTYDVESASKRVDEFIEENSNDPIAGVHFPSDWVKHFISGGNDFDCVPYGRPESYRIAAGGSEFTFRMIGAVDDFSLPPFDRHRLHSSKIQYIQQMLSLNSLRASHCTKDVEAVQDIIDTFLRRVPFDADQTWTAVLDNSVRFSNRLLVPTDENQRQAVCPLPFAVDPTGALRAKAESYGLVHTDDNVVEYLRLVDDKYVVTTPAAIRRGDIAEIRFSVGLFATHKSTLLVKLILRAIIVIDIEFSRIARRVSAMAGIPATATLLKRKRVVDESKVDPGSVTKMPRVKPPKKVDSESPRATSLPCSTVDSPGQGVYGQDVEMTDDVGTSSPAL